MKRNENYTDPSKEVPIDTEYRNCNFSRKEPLEVDGKKVGHPLDINARFVECNLVNRKPHPDAVLVRCNTALVDTEIVEKVVVDKTAEIESANLDPELVKMIPKEITTRNVTRPFKMYGHYDIETKELITPVVIKEVIK